MVLEGVSYSAYIQLCRVILSRMGTLLWPVFNLTLSGLDVRLDRYLCPILFPPAFLLLIHCLLHHLLQNYYPFHLARVYQQTSVFELKVCLTCHGRRTNSRVELALAACSFRRLSFRSRAAAYRDGCLYRGGI